MPRNSDDWHVLRDGPTVPAQVVRFLLRLHDQGITVARRADRVRVFPANALTPDDRAALRRWRDHVLAIAAYLERDDLDAHLRGVQ